MLDAIVERIEVLDGLRGDSLDKAVTYRDLGDSGFTIIPGAGGTQQIVNTPGSGDGLTPGVAAAPEDLAVAETFLALMLTWTNPSFNLQHIEVWRSATDNLSLADLLGTTVSPQFMDYVGANATYYYWVRAVGTDGTYSSYNAVAGTEGTTGIDPSSISIDGDEFFIVDPGAGQDIAPFIIGTVNGETAVGLNGQFIVDGTIRATSIVADSIGAREIFVEDLSVISADMGEITAGVIRTAASPAYRVEIEDQASTAYPLWYGTGPKAAPGGRFYVQADGTVVVKGLLDAGMIKQTFFAPAHNNDSFRVAVDYPGEYSGGVYTGKRAHLFPIQTVNFQDYAEKGYRIAPLSTYPPGYLDSDVITFESPSNSSSTEYGRLGSYSEMLLIQYDVAAFRWHDNKGNDLMHCILMYQYDADGWKDAFEMAYRAGQVGSGGVQQLFVSRDSPTWETLSFKVRVKPDYSARNADMGVNHISLMVWAPNFGYADADLQIQPANNATPVEQLPDYPKWDGITP